MTGLMRIYRWKATGQEAARIDATLAERVDAVKAARSPEQQVEVAGLLVLDPDELEVVELAYREAVDDDPRV